MNYSLNHIGTNANGNLEMALVATPDFTETNGNSSDIGVVVVLTGGAYLINTFENDCVPGPPPTGTVCDYAIPKAAKAPKNANIHPKNLYPTPDSR